MFCTNCGSSLPDGLKFCTNCGAALANAPAAMQPASSVANEVIPEAVKPEVKPQPETVEVISHVKPEVAENQPEAYVPTIKAAAPQPQPEAVVRNNYSSVPQAVKPAVQPTPSPVEEKPAVQPAPSPVEEKPAQGFASQPQNSFAPQPQNGFGQQPMQGGYVQPAQGFASQSQNGFASQSQNGFASQPQNGFAPQSQNGFAPQPQNGFGQQPMQGGYAQSVSNFAPQPQDGFSQQPMQSSFAQGMPPVTPIAPVTGTYNQTSQNAFAQPSQNAAQPKKANIGKILGLAIGIPVGVLTLIIVGIIIIAVNVSNRSRNIVDNPDPSPIVSPVGPDIVVSDAVDRTLMIYMVGSNLESPDEPGVTGGFASMDLDEIMAANIPEGVNVIVQCGGAYNWENPDVPDGEVTRFKIEDHKLVKLEELGRTTMTKEGDLQSFIEFGAEYFPAEKYDLLLWNHGGGVPIGFGIDQLGDEGEMLTDAEIGEELKNSGLHFEVVIFDACNMCSLEVGKALQPTTDYMVGAESYVNGIGIYYTNWISAMDKDIRDVSEIIVKDYMNSLDEYGLVGSMSLIRLDQIDEVYDAYVNYVASLSTYVFRYGDYAGYYRTRGNCGLYQGTDSVDLITLATKYNTDASTALINAVVNSVVYTESDIAYGHGLTAYSPYEYFYLYTEGRESLVKLGYDEAVIDFYDDFMSVMLAYMGDAYVDYYAGSWFNHDYDGLVADEGVSSGEYGPGTSGYEYDDVYPLDTVDAGYYAAVELTDEDWEIVDNISLSFYVVDEDTGDYLMLGKDYTHTTDSAGRLALVDPEAWVYLNNNIVTYYCTDIYEDDATGEWAQYGEIAVWVNGKTAFLTVYYDNDHPYGAIQGYYFYDYDTDVADSTVRMLQDTDKVTIMYQYYIVSTGEVEYEEGETYYAKDLELQYLTFDFDDYTTLGFYTVITVYGTTYETDLEYLGSRKYI